MLMYTRVWKPYSGTESLRNHSELWWKLNSQGGDREEGMNSDCFCCCSVVQLCPILCDPMDCSMPGFPVLPYLPEFAQTHVHWIGDSMQPSHPLNVGTHQKKLLHIQGQRRSRSKMVGGVQSCLKSNPIPARDTQAKPCVHQDPGKGAVTPPPPRPPTHTRNWSRPACVTALGWGYFKQLPFPIFPSSLGLPNLLVE